MIILTNKLGIDWAKKLTDFSFDFLNFIES
jgi:hypothetical protein